VVAVPGTKFLDVILARNVATERRKNELLLVQAATEFLKLITRCNVRFKFFLRTVQQRCLCSQFISHSIRL